jgi:hypothetical protein
MRKASTSYGRSVITFLVASAFLAAPGYFSAPINAGVVVRHSGGLGIIKGVVRDQAGSAIADATVAIFRVGTSRVLKEVRSAADGSFIAKILPGTYTVLAVAEGFNPVRLPAVEVNGTSELVYGFKLERAGGGNTLPEKSTDRNSSKWRIRAAGAQRSIYQNVEGETPVDDDDVAAATPTAKSDERAGSILGRPQTAIETYFASSEAGNYTGINFATLLPVGDTTAVVLAGQASTGSNGPQRFDASIKFRPNRKHLVRTNASIGRLGTAVLDKDQRSLGQFSFQALDEWTVREGVVVVFGFDYSRFVGASNDFSISPRLGFQYDLDSRTRFRTAYTAQNEKRTWANAIELEDTTIAFQEPVSVDDLIVENGRPQLNKSSRFEFGIERILDNASSIEATAFIDTTVGRGVGLNAIPFDTLNEEGFTDIVADQQGRSQGVRVVYNRRLGSLLNAAAGYSFGHGQKLSSDTLTDPSSIFETAVFHSLFGQLSADFKTGTNVRTVFRLSPQAAVFAIDPFQGRLAIYDPSLSVLITQNLPTLGLPFHAQAIVDARNLFDFQTGVIGEEGALRIKSQRRALRGGILVRF